MVMFIPWVPRIRKKSPNKQIQVNGVKRGPYKWPFKHMGHSGSNFTPIKVELFGTLLITITGI